MNTLEMFAAVVEHHSLNRASQLLNLSQPALSRKIAGLEAELGVRLFDRQGKRLSLTQAGHVCYEYAVKLRSLNRDMQQALRPFQSLLAPQSLTIGASLTTLQSTLPELITLYTRDYPQTDIKLLTGKTHEVVSFVQERKVDIGLVASVIDHPGLVCVPLFDDHLCLVLPLGHPLLGERVVPIRLLNGLPLILFSQGTWYRVLTDEIFERHHIVPNVKMEIDSFEAIVRLVSTCQTATLLPRSYLARTLLDNNELTVVEIPELRLTKRTTSLIYVEEAARSSALHPFVWEAKQHFAEEE